MLIEQAKKVFNFTINKVRKRLPHSGQRPNLLTTIRFRQPNEISLKTRVVKVKFNEDVWKDIDFSQKDYDNLPEVYNNDCSTAAKSGPVFDDSVHAGPENHKNGPNSDISVHAGPKIGPSGPKTDVSVHAGPLENRPITTEGVSSKTTYSKLSEVLKDIILSSDDRFSLIKIF
jgi:hypothetical protein